MPVYLSAVGPPHLSCFASLPAAGLGSVRVKVHFCKDGTHLPLTCPGRLAALLGKSGSQYFLLHGKHVFAQVRGSAKEGWSCRLDADGKLEILLILKVRGVYSCDISVS